jgi:hypothetical protein
MTECGITFNQIFERAVPEERVFQMSEESGKPLYENLRPAEKNEQE